MSEGYPEVEKYMTQVSAAIKRHVTDEYASTDIYNRCFEAIWEALKAGDSHK